MNIFHDSLRIALFGSTAALSLAMPCLAQAANDSPKVADSGASAAGDIIVTAQRKDEKLSKVPVAVTVLSSDTLAKAQIVSEQDLRSATPGLSVRTAGDSGTLNYSLRGQSQDSFSGTRPGVLPYINDVQIGGSGSTAFYDLQGVQVLKGPQGTLFGRSATGGAVLFNTAKPTDKLGGYINATYGNYNAFKVEGALNVPLAGSALMARVAGFYEKRDGFQRNLFNNTRAGDIERSAIRGSITANFSGIHNELMVDYYHSDSQNTVGVLSGLQPFTGGVNPPYVPIQFLYAGTDAGGGSTATGEATLQAFTFGPTATPAQIAIINAAYLAYYAPGTGHPTSGIAGFLAAQQARGPYVVSSDAANFYKADNLIVTNATTIELGASTKLKNIFGFTNIKSSQSFDADDTPDNISQTTTIGQPYCSCQTTRQFSDELQLLGTAFNDRLSYVTGLYFSHDKFSQNQHAEFFALVANVFGLPSQQSTLVYTVTNTTYAGYAQGTYKLNDSGLAFTLGARYTSEKIELVKLPGDTFVVSNITPATPYPIAPTGYSYDQATTYNKLSWQIGLQDQVNPNLLIYAVSRRAYKSGGYNGQVSPKVGFSEIAGDAYKAEQVTDAELGLKYQGRVADLPTNLSLSLYHSWVNNSQRTAFTLVGSPTAITVNVPSEKIYGAEFAAQVKPAKWLVIGGSLNYTHPEYTNGNVIANGAAQIFDQVPDTPKFSGALFADVTVPVSGNLDATLHGDVYNQSMSFMSPQSINSTGTIIDGYTLANFRIGIEDKKAGWSLIGSVKNAFNQVYYVGGVPTGNIYQINTKVPGDPRLFTVAARFKF